MAAAQASRWGMCLQTFCQVPKAGRLGWSIQRQHVQSSPKSNTPQWNAVEASTNTFAAATPSPAATISTEVVTENNADSAGDQGGDYEHHNTGQQETMRQEEKPRVATRWSKNAARRSAAAHPTTTSSAADVPAANAPTALQTFATVAAGTTAAL